MPKVNTISPFRLTSPLSAILTKEYAVVFFPRFSSPVMLACRKTSKSALTWFFASLRSFSPLRLMYAVKGIATVGLFAPLSVKAIVIASLETPVTEGNNIAKGATVIEASSQGGTRNPLSYLLDGDLGTMFQGAKVTEDYKYELGGYKHEFVIDLGAVKNFDTYTIVNAGSKSSNKNNNTSEWELFVSDDGKTWTSVDYQSGNKADTVSFNIGDTSARYVKLRIFSTDQSANVGTVRLYEFMLFGK